MATIKVKEAQSQWKKVKPRLLTKTGISQKLGALNGYDRKSVAAKDVAKWKKTFNDVLTFTHAREKDQKIKKHSKCIKFLQDLGDSLAAENSALNLLDAKAKEQERKEKEAQAWIKTLNASLKDLARIKQKGLKIQQQINQAGTRVETFDKTTFDKVSRGLAAEVAAVQMERRNAKPGWFTIQKAIRDSKHQGSCKLLDDVIRQDAEIRQDSGGLEQKLLDAIHDFNDEFDKLEKKRAEELKQWIAALGSAAKTLDTATKSAEAVLKEIESALDGDPSQAKQQHAALQTRANKVQEIRRNTKVSWYSFQTAIRGSGDTTANALLKKVVELDNNLREDSQGLELSMKSLLAQLLKAASAPPPSRLSSTHAAALKKHLALTYPGTDERSAKVAFHRWALKNHPDKGGNTKTFQEVNEAYNALLDVLG